MRGTASVRSARCLVRKVVENVRRQVALQGLAISVHAELAEGLQEEQHLHRLLWQLLDLGVSAARVTVRMAFETACLTHESSRERTQR